MTTDALAAAIADLRAPSPDTPRAGPWMQLSDGRPWWLLYPEPTDVRWRTIAVALARLPRYNGHQAEDVQHPWSVAAHCCLVSDALPPRLRLHGLLHDAAEAVLGDLTQPLKTALHSLGGLAGWTSLERVTDEVIHLAAGIDRPTEAQAMLIRHEDLRALATERRDLLLDGPLPWAPLPDPYPTVLRPRPWQVEADAWLERLRALLPDTALVRA